MRGHMKKHHTRRPASFEVKRKKSIEWKKAIQHEFKDISLPATSLRGMRNREGWTQTQLAEKIGVNQANLSKMETGKRAIGKIIAKRLAIVFETDYRLFL